MISAKLANRIWIASQLGEAKTFHKNCFRLATSQQEKLKNYLTINSNTKFGTHYKFNQIANYKNYQAAVPIQEWEDIEPWVELIKKGEQQILTREPVLLFEETSGTSSFSKLIPYTSSLKNEMQKGIGSWMVSLYKNHRRAFEGCSYWSISPPLKEKRETAAGIAIGIEDDTDYFNPLSRFLLNKIIAIPSEIKKELNAERFYFQTFEHLLMKEELSFVSVWSPTFFLQLNDFLTNQKYQLLVSLEKKYGTNNKRIRFLKERLGASYTWKEVWPQLSVLSCWCDAQSAIWIQTVKSTVGNVYIQAKGLLSTEGICSIPLLENKSPVLSVNSHFYEFRELDTDAIFLAYELKKDGIYEIILTTGGGLYRYASGDLIVVDGFYGDAPLFRFLGRKKNQSDLVGEKLSEFQVSQALHAALKNISEKIELAFVYPLLSKTNDTHYRIYIESKPEYQLELADLLLSIATNVEQVLQQNPYYKQAIGLRQLNKSKVFLLPSGFKNKLLDYYKTSFQIKDGNIKIPVLFKKDSLNSILSTLD